MERSGSPRVGSTFETVRPLSSIVLKNLHKKTRSSGRWKNTLPKISRKTIPKKEFRIVKKSPTNTWHSLPSLSIFRSFYNPSLIFLQSAWCSFPFVSCLWLWNIFHSSPFIFSLLGENVGIKWEIFNWLYWGFLHWFLRLNWLSQGARDHTRWMLDGCEAQVWWKRCFRLRKTRPMRLPIKGFSSSTSCLQWNGNWRTKHLGNALAPEWSGASQFWTLICHDFLNSKAGYFEVMGQADGILARCESGDR